MTCTPSRSFSRAGTRTRTTSSPIRADGHGMTKKRALGPGATCCGECDLCCPNEPTDDMFEVTAELADELGLSDEEEDE